MKALTIIQPWATLIAIGAKKIETRSWATKYRGPLAIHAGMNRDFCNMRGKDYICGTEPFLSVLTKHLEALEPNRVLGFMPLGAVIAICNLVGCAPVTGAPLSEFLTDREKAFGDYTEGRFMWFLEDVVQIKPAYIKGAQGLWNWER